MLTVVKVGGRIISDDESLSVLADAVAGLQGDVVVVHGGGPEITAWQERAGIPVRWESGLRVTCSEGVRVASMVLSGWTNKRLVGALSQAGLQAVGLSGEDGGLVSAFKKRGGALGEVGTVAAVQPAVLDALIGNGFLPVVSPVSTGPGGRPLNVNADEVAGALAVALRADRLLLVSDAPGVLADGQIQETLDLASARGLIDSGVAQDGMIVKLNAAANAAGAGVLVVIGGPGILTGRGGTRVVRRLALGAA